MMNFVSISRPGAGAGWCGGWRTGDWPSLLHHCWAGLGWAGAGLAGLERADVMFAAFC